MVAMNDKPKEEILSKDMQVAVETYGLSNVKGEKVWFTKLTRSLKGYMSQSRIHEALQSLRAWGIIKVQYGETDTGKAGRLLLITGEAEETIAMLYEKFWKNRTKK